MEVKIKRVYVVSVMESTFYEADCVCSSYAKVISYLSKKTGYSELTLRKRHPKKKLLSCGSNSVVFSKNKLVGESVESFIVDRMEVDAYE
jgi:hypothetical protein